MPEIRFGVQHGPHRSPPVSAQRMINCYLEVATPGARTQAPVVPSYGISQFSNLNEAVITGTVVNGVLYVHTQNQLLEIDATGASTLLGTQAINTEALIEGDGFNLVTIANGTAYLYDGNTYGEITDPDFPMPQWIGYIDGFFPVIEEGTGRFWINETPFQPGDWNPLDFATAETNPDDLVWGLIDKGEIILFGKVSTEFWWNQGNADFPFSRIPNGRIETGIMSRWAAGKIGNLVAFMGHDGIAYQLNGYQPVRISTHAMEQAIDGYTKECRVLTWHEAGHAMIAYCFPEGCWVYDLATQLWHQRRTYGSSTWNIDFVLRAYERYVTIGKNNTAIGQLTPDVFTEYGDIMRTQCTSASVYDRNNFVTHDRVELLFETGDSGGDVMLRYSDDGGRTWSSEIWHSLGEQGDYDSRVIYSDLGGARDRVYEYSISAETRRTFMQANLNEWG